MRLRGTLLALSLVLVLAACGNDDDDAPAQAGDPASGTASDAAPESATDTEAPGGDGTDTPLSEEKVTTYGDDAPANHVPGNVEYAEAPPMGGDHDAAPLVCGTYDEPVREENAVHSLEHGAIWVTYDPEQVDETAIRRFELALSDKAIISPYDDLPAPVVVTAWNRQLQLSGWDDGGFHDFVAEYRDGHTSPEPNVPCDYGVERFESEDESSA